jgi:hypothetical protein
MLTGIYQDVYVSPADRARPGVTRSTLMTGFAIGAVQYMAIDPDARFLVLEVLHTNGDRELVQLAIVASPTVPIGSVAQLWDFSAVPELPELMSAAIRDHSAYGRALLFGHAIGRAVIFDQDNDGVFDATELYTDDQSWFSKYPSQAWSRSY